jgi:transcriptional regulator with XRE-family HTH domain
VTQPVLADAVGISIPTLSRYERLEVKDPSLKVLVNCAIALGVELHDVCEPEWFEWNAIVESRAAPPRSPLARNR